MGATTSSPPDPSPKSERPKVRSDTGYSYSNIPDGGQGQGESDALSPKSTATSVAQAQSREPLRPVLSVPEASPAQTTKVRVWQLVLFTACLFLMIVCTVMVLVSYCGGFLGYAPVTPLNADHGGGIHGPESVEPLRPKAAVPLDPWRLDKVSFDCSTSRWSKTQDWSDIKMDYCCENAGMGCERVPSYSCDKNAVSIFVEKRWCCSLESIFCNELDAEMEAHRKQGIGQCRHSQESCRHFDCEDGKEQWWLEWAALKIQWCCHERYDCGGAGSVLQPKARGTSSVDPSQGPLQT